jgi:hypothetical protein
MEVFLAFAPRGAGLLCALACKEHGQHLAGWFTGMVGYEVRSAYFFLEGFYTRQSTDFWATAGGDLYGGWCFNYEAGPQFLDPPVRVPDELCHELEQLQDACAAEWLWYADVKSSEQERRAYAGMELACQAVNVRAVKLNKFDRAAAVWTYASPHFDRNVLEYMARHWPLDCRAD